MVSAPAGAPQRNRSTPAAADARKERCCMDVGSSRSLPEASSVGGYLMAC
jgi:hypothetical protein